MYASSQSHAFIVTTAAKTRTAPMRSAVSRRRIADFIGCGPGSSLAIVVLVGVGKLLEPDHVPTPEHREDRQAGDQREARQGTQQTRRGVRGHEGTQREQDEELRLGPQDGPARRRPLPRL